MEKEDPYQYIKDLNVKIERILHAEQDFIYEELVFEGDTLTMETEIIDMYDKKDGLLQFCVLESRFINQNNIHIGTLKYTVVVR
jgi:acyl dehydratase